MSPAHFMDWQDKCDPESENEGLTRGGSSSFFTFTEALLAINRSSPAAYYGPNANVCNCVSVGE